MDQYVINIPDDHRRFFAEMLRNLPWIEVEQKRRTRKPAQSAKETPEEVYARLTPAQRERVDGLKQALVDVERHQRGEIKMVSAEEHLAELRAIRDAQWPPAE